MKGFQIIRHQNFTPIHIGEPTHLFQKIIKRLDNSGLKWCVGGGTVLGLVRDKKLIPTDTDLDFNILCKDGSVEEGNKIRELMSDLPLFMEVKYDTKNKNQLYQLAYTPGIVVDFHFYYQRDDKYVCYHQAGELEIPFHEFGKPVEIETKYGKVFIPERPEEYLLGKYGENWRTPIYQGKGVGYKTTGMVFGCFDPPHFGHLKLIRRCYEFVETLFIIVRSDNHIRRYKNREPFMDEVTRGRLMGLMGKVHVSEDKEPDYWVDKLKPRFFFCEQGKGETYKNLSADIIEIERTPGIDSTGLRS